MLQGVDVGVDGSDDREIVDNITTEMVSLYSFVLEDFPNNKFSHEVLMGQVKACLFLKPNAEWLGVIHLSQH